MISITLNTFMGMEKLLGGKKSQVIELPKDSTVESMIKELGNMFGKEFTHSTMSGQHRLKEGLVIMVNGVNIFAVDGFNTKLHDGDSVLLFPPVGGG